jgi:hypothetical protein
MHVVDEICVTQSVDLTLFPYLLLPRFHIAPLHWLFTVMPTPGGSFEPEGERLTATASARDAVQAPEKGRLRQRFRTQVDDLVKEGEELSVKLKRRVSRSHKRARVSAYHPFGQNDGHYKVSLYVGVLEHLPDWLHGRSWVSHAPPRWCQTDECEAPGTPFDEIGML